MSTYTLRRSFATWVLLLLLILPITALFAQKPGSNAKVSDDLLLLKREYTKSLLNSAGGRLTFESENPLLQVRGAYVVVDITAHGDVETLKGQLTALGMQNTTSFQHIISGLMPIAKLDQVGTLRGLHYAAAAYKPGTNIGAVTSQGDVAQRSDLARSGFRVNGKGSTVGVLSDSYNNITGERLGVLTGDLPGRGNPNGFTTPITVLKDLASGGSDEGRAMCEIVHDVAPGANQAFYTAFDGQADFANGILALQQKAGCNIIVDDVFYYAEPFFQDGIIAQATDMVKAKGVSYFSSAGNNARNAYQSPFRPAGQGTADGIAHNFNATSSTAPVDSFQVVRITPGSTGIFSFQWSNPYFSVTGDTLKQATTDLDIFLYNDKGELVASGGSNNLKSGDPIEVFGYTNNGPSVDFRLMIRLYAGPAPAVLKYIAYSATIRNYGTNSATCSGHANAAGALATGAARYDATPAFGVAVPRIEAFSSAGGTPILFDLKGNELSPRIVRQKPEFTAPNGGNTTFFIPGLDYEGDGFANFFGTSASAPHAAAVAALVRQAAGKIVSPNLMRETLQNSAVDMDDPRTLGFDRGFDFGTGYGLIRADESVAAVYPNVIVNSFSLINADNGTVIRTINDGDVLVLGTLPTRNLTIRANTFPATLGYVDFYLNDQFVITSAEAPYSLTNSLQRPLMPQLMTGNYTLLAYPHAAGTGKTGVELTVRFRVVENAVASLTLLEANTGRALTTLEDNDILDAAKRPAQLTIRANTLPRTVGSVVFQVNGRQERRDSQFPYTLTENTTDSTFVPFMLRTGRYRVAATPYTAANGGGIMGDALRLAFEVIDSRTDPAARLNALADEMTNSLEAFPNPFADRVLLRFSVNETQQATLGVYDVRGTLIQPLHKGLAEAGQTYEYTFDAAQLPQGMYFSRLLTDKLTKAQKIVLSR